MKGWGKNPKRWSKLQKQIYNLIDPFLDFQIHCSVYRMQSQRGSTDLPRYWITFEKEIIFDCPKDTIHTQEYEYPYQTDISDISSLIREYIDAPKDKLLNDFENDHWGLIDILRVADRRIGKRQLKKIKENIEDENILKIIARRLK